ncbi:hypothetical protein GC173_00815 [bacterium]|nr:hypothetical protein [bacterium]
MFALDGGVLGRELKTFLENKPGELKEKTMSLAEELIQEGRAKGIEEGGLRALRRSACRLVRARFGDDRQVASALDNIDSLDRLEDLLAFIAAAKTLDEVVAALR